MTATISNDYNVSVRRGSSSASVAVPPSSLTVTKNVNSSTAVSEEHRLQASDYLASYIKVPDTHDIDVPRPVDWLALPCCFLVATGI